MQRDDNSRSSAGKKKTITGFKINKQKRFLNDCMKHLHAKFLSENPEYKECRICKEKVIIVDLLENDLGKQINWKKWTTRRVEKVKKVQGEEIKYATFITTREEEQGTVETLVEDFQANLKKTLIQHKTPICYITKT